LKMWNATGTSSWTKPDGVSSLEYLVVAGGGGGAGANSGWTTNHGGGGAGGSIINGTNSSLPSSITIVVGSGGNGGSSTTAGYKGINSTILNVIAIGGNYGNYGTAGGLGGIGSSGAGSGGRGGYEGAGGCGATNGGNGNISLINDTSVYYSGGGGGGQLDGCGSPRPGGLGGGGAGANSGSGSAGTNGLGGGGGGGSFTTGAGSGGNGGSGIVIVKYLTPVSPVASFTTNATTGIAPLSVKFNDTSTNTPTSWKWGFKNLTPGNNTWTQFSTSQSPAQVFGVGNWSINLTATNAAGSNISTQVTWINVTVTAPVASFNTNVTTGVDPLSVKFNDTSTNTPTSWKWGFKNLTPGNNTWIQFSTSQSPAQVFGIGNWSINLTSTNYGGSNISTQVTWVNVSPPPPTANFTSNVTIGIVYPMVVQFNDTSINTPTMWNWSFGDGRWFNTTDSSLRNTTYQYSVAGKYKVNLTVNNSYGSNTTSKTNYINLTSDNDDNLVSWLHMNGANDSIVFTGEKGTAWNVMGAAHITTSTYVFGNSSGDFTGSKSYIYAASSPVFNFSSTGDMEIEMWVKPMSSGKDVSLIKRGNPGQSAGWGVFHSTTASDSSAWVFWMGNDTTGATNTFTLPIGSWSHLVLSADTLGGNEVYVNGTLVATRTGMTANYDTNNPVYLGYRSSPVKYFDGYIDEFRISNIERWKSNFTTPYAQYNGILETVYPDINPNSTFRYKTLPEELAYIDNVTNGGTRNRTLQIQNITNTSYVLGAITFNPLYVLTKSVQLNTSYYPTGMTLVSSSIDNVNGIIEFNISKPTGFSPGTDRASILDYTVLYYNYTNGDTNVSQYFEYGYLINGTTQKTYPVHNFILTQVTYGDWNFTANFTANNLTPLNNTPITFTSTFTGSYPNRWNWSFGDGTFDDGTNSTTNHTYITPGLKTVTLTEYLWQNASVSNITSRTDYINVMSDVSLPIVQWTLDKPTVRFPGTITVNDTSLNTPTSWEYYWGDGTANGTTNNATHQYVKRGVFQVTLNVTNSAGSNISVSKQVRVIGY